MHKLGKYSATVWPTISFMCVLLLEEMCPYIKWNEPPERGVPSHQKEWLLIEQGP